jgi:hypothetical protein
MTIRWVLGWHRPPSSTNNHPIGVFKALGGHLLMIVTELSERPGGNACEACPVAAQNTTALP